MNPKRRQRLLLVIGLIALAGIAVGLTLYALRSNLNLFYTPQQIVQGQAPVGRSLRAGGVVRFGSVKRATQGVAVEFSVTDYAADVKVRYDGILPDLFREGQGVVVVGKLGTDGVVEASQVLAKHDEKYTPPEVLHALQHEGKIPKEYSFLLDAGITPLATQSVIGVSRLGEALDATDQDTVK